jgi:hypothetical protein
MEPATSWQLRTRVHVPSGTLAMVNMSGSEGLEAWTVAISLVA